MSVHHAISKHSESQHYIVKRFTELDQLREQYIEEAIDQCRNHQVFTTKKINEITNEMNELGKKGIVTSLPLRKNVTDEMIREFVASKTK